MMAKTGMIVVTNPSRLIKHVPRLQREINKTLYIQYFPEKRLRLSEKLVKQLNPPSYCNTVQQFYASTLSLEHIDVRVLLGSLRDSKATRISTKSPVEVVYFDHLLNNEEMHKFLSNCVANLASNCEVVALESSQDPSQEEDPDESRVYDHVVLGGTFDRLHQGHKILLSEAVLRTNSKVTVGVTETEMLKSKKLWELVEPCQVRIDKVRDFLEDVEPSLQYDVVPINDMYGPTKDDPSFQMIVVSSETVKGGSEVNKLRQKNGLNPLDIHSVELLNDIKQDDIEEDKISSSNYRLRMLGTLIRDPKPNTTIPPRPYIIGLTGGIASGKSSVSSKAHQLGAGVISCDALGHLIYKKEEPGHKLIIEKFGKKVLNANGEIDRQVLGGIVFQDKAALAELNSLLWPEILQKAKEMSLKLYNEGHEVVIMEAALLVQAGWHDHCHEIWTCVIPKAEAVKRLQERNGLSLEAAEARISSQLSNEDQLCHSNVVFCTLWSPEFTQKQVERAWASLRARLSPA